MSLKFLPKRILIGGPDGVGKSTLCGKLLASEDLNPLDTFERRAFARGVREEVLDPKLQPVIFQRYVGREVTDKDGEFEVIRFLEAEYALDKNGTYFTEKEVYGKPTTRRMRHVLRDWGTPYRRGQNPDYWVNYYDSKASDSCVIDDGRFANEGIYGRENGFLLLFIDNPDGWDRSVPSFEELHLLKAMSHVVLPKYPDIDEVLETISLLCRPPIAKRLGIEIVPNFHYAKPISFLDLLKAV